MANKGFKVKRHVVSGELSGKAKTSSDVLDEVGRLLDKSYSNDIVGPALIEGANGKFYKICVEAEFVEVSRDEAERMADENGEEL